MRSLFELMTHNPVYLSICLSVYISVREHVLPQTQVHEGNFHTKEGIISISHCLMVVRILNVCLHVQRLPQILSHISLQRDKYISDVMMCSHHYVMTHLI